ncbi:hypothetical protein D4758_06455 [Enterocloster citroniae]|nr:hypothetical protein [Enterocloster citroniae]
MYIIAGIYDFEKKSINSIITTGVFMIQGDFGELPQRENPLLVEWTGQGFYRECGYTPGKQLLVCILGKSQSHA